MFGNIVSVKRCSRCGQWLDRDSFSPNAKRSDGLQTYCRACQRAYMREHYERNRDYYLAKAKRSNEKQRTWLRLLLKEMKAVPCADCGIQYPSWVMQFDHVRGTKLFDVSSAPNLDLGALLAEAAKCEIVCSNCHHVRTRQRAARAPIAQSG